MPDIDEMKCYLVRTHESLLPKDIAGIGWSDFNFSSFSNAEKAIQTIKKSYDIGKRSNQIRRFFKIKEGDLIVIPLPYRIVIAKATGRKLYDDNLIGIDKSNLIEIKPLKDITGKIKSLPRDSFSEAFQRRIRVRGITINNLSEFQDEIKSAYMRMENGQDYSWLDQVNSEIESHKKVFREKLLKNIQYGKTNLKTGGLGLELLVKELLELDGYKAKILPKNKYKGKADADIHATRADMCSSNNILLQIKHHQGFTNDYGLKQLSELQKLYPDEIDECELVFLTSASITESAREKAQNLNIKALDGEDLVYWIEEHIDSLSKETKSSLGIFEVPSLVNQ